RHAPPCAGHPRLTCCNRRRKTWMAGRKRVCARLRRAMPGHDDGESMPRCGRDGPRLSLLLRQLHQLEACELRALIRHLEIAADRLSTKLEWVRLARLAACDHPDLGHRVVELGMVRHQDGGACGGCCRRHLALRRDVSVEMRYVIGEVEGGAA